MDEAGAILGLAVVTTVIEALGKGGWDNLFLVLGAVLWMLGLEVSEASRYRLLLGLAAAMAFATAAWRFHLLTLSGTLAAGLLAVSLVGFGGVAWTVPAVTFFVLASGLSRLGGERKARAAVQAEKGSRRDAGQVYANGGIAWALLLVSVIWPSPVLFWGFAAAFAAAAADTWATEIGTWVGGPTRMVWSRRVVAPGLSGGVSRAGTLGALAGACSIWVAVLLAAPEAVAELGGALSLLVVAGAGFLGAFADSVAGELLQAGYRDRETGTLTDLPLTAGRPNALVKGVAWVTNDRVNVLNTLIGATVGLALAALF